MMKRLPGSACLVMLLAGASALSAQTPTPTPTPSPTPTPTPASPTTIPAGQTWTTDASRAVNGVRIVTAPDGSTWFLTPSNDRIVRLQNGVMTQWQIRTDKQIGANPVDFEIDGDLVWFIENGESEIDAGKSVFARLDTSTGRLREWVLPTSRPGGFWRAPNRQIWIPQTAGLLQRLDLDTLAVEDFRADVLTFASGVVSGPDGALWMADFGSNRIIRYLPGDSRETAWTLLDPATGFRLNPSHLAFDEDGFLWISEFSGSRLDRFDPSTGEVSSFFGFTAPIHFASFAGRVYVTEATGGNGRVVVLDPRFAPRTSQKLTPQTIEVRSLPDPRSATIRDSTITPTTFTPKNDPIAAANLKVSSLAPGLLVFEFPSINAYGIDVQGGAVWVGSEGKLARLLPQTIGGASDLTVPVAIQYGGPPADTIRVNLTLYNKGSAAISGEALYLFSPASFASRKTFTVGPGETTFLEDSFVGSGASGTLSIGPVRLRVSQGQASDLIATVRSARVSDDGSSFGIALPAQAVSESLGAGTTRTLFTGIRSTETSVFGFYSPSGAQATATLFAPDGTVRGTRTISIETNVNQEFNPAASFFGASPEPGDAIRIQVTSGVLQPYVNVLDNDTHDVALSLPVAAATDAVVPNAGTGVGGGSVLFVSDLFLWNTDPATAATVTATYDPLFSAGPPATATLLIAPNAGRTIPNVVSTLFGAAAGQGAITLSSNVPVAAALRMSAQAEKGQYAGFAAALDGTSFVPAGGSTAIGLPQTATRRTNLLLFNRGAAGTITVTGFDGSGGEIGRLVLPVGDHESTRVDRVFQALGSPGTTLGRIRVEGSPGTRLYGMTVELDGKTGDADPLALR